MRIVRCAFGGLRHFVARPLAAAAFPRKFSAEGSEPVLSQLARVVSKEGTGAIQQLAAHPDAAELRRDQLRRLSAEAEKDSAKAEEAIREAEKAMEEEHFLVRLAGIHAIARVSPVGTELWHKVAELSDDPEELVRVAVPRAIGRMAEPGDAEALEFLDRMQQETKDRSVRYAARDAANRLRGSFGALGGGSAAAMLG
ncbi:unnamed protein product [Effrenium voratum]|uniref:HEAT repeat domain-containing protein n=1 Tax=Effrenium voratum TaxID=2562239 RepID=A0AA36HP43_9DINO|nr:unnamed protein product [Effrenium voratum]CAJ1444038.1 unnamed protein product [Effrenium voratum]